MNEEKIVGQSHDWPHENRTLLGPGVRGMDGGAFVAGGAAIPGAQNLAGQQAKIVDPWKHRSAGMTCSTCMWFAPKASERLGDRSSIGRCRRHAPTMNGYPVVYLTDWCGDHKLDENKI